MPPEEQRLFYASLFPGLQQRVVGDGLALGLLVGEFGLGGAGLVQPVGLVLLLVELGLGR